MPPNCRIPSATLRKSLLNFPLDLSGDCPWCHHPIQIPRSDIFCATPIFYKFCDRCHQHYSLLCPKTLQANVRNNIASLLNRYEKIAVWGMTNSITLHRLKTAIFSLRMSSLSRMVPRYIILESKNKKNRIVNDNCIIR